MTRARSTFAQLLLAALAACLLAWAPASNAADEAAAAAPAATAGAAAAPVEKIPNEKCFKCHDDAEYESDGGASSTRATT